jgi:hypothetical protein
MQTGLRSDQERTTYPVRPLRPRTPCRQAASRAGLIRSWGGSLFTPDGVPCSMSLVVLSLMAENNLSRSGQPRYALCRTLPLRGLHTEAIWSDGPDLQTWRRASRRNLARGLHHHLSEPRIRSTFEQLFSHHDAATANLQRLLVQRPALGPAWAA